MRKISKIEILIVIPILFSIAFIVWRWHQPPAVMTDKTFKEIVVGLLFWIAINTSGKS